MLEVEALHVRRGGTHVLHGVSLNVHAHEIVALLGANGAGKSTFLTTLSGLLRPISGRIRLTVDRSEHDLVGMAPEAVVKLGVAHCPEGRQIFAGLTVAENLRMGAYLRRDGAQAADLAALQDHFPVLRERLHARAGSLSGGEQMMLAMARALMSRPRLLLLDEPSLGLAPQMVDRIFDVILDIRRRGTTVLMVEQNALRALEIADRGYVLENGRIVLHGAAGDLATDPDVRSAYLGMGASPASAPP